MRKHHVRLTAFEVYLVNILMAMSNLKQHEIARRNGVSQSTISRINTKKHRFS